MIIPPPDDSPEEMVIVYHGPPELMTRHEFEAKLKKGDYPLDVECEIVKKKEEYTLDGITENKAL
jgi:hypothetical protein